MFSIRSRLTYANVMATVAVFVALGGGAYAVSIAPRNSVKSSSIKNGQVKTADLANSAVTGTKIKAHNVGAAKVNASQIQLRLSQGCLAGSAIRDIAADGTATCQSDTAGPAYTANSPLTLSGGAFGLQSCSAGQILKFTTSWGCADDVPVSLIGTDTNQGAQNLGDGDVCQGYGSVGRVNLRAKGRYTNQEVPASGQALSISSNATLFSVLGTAYGGNGSTNFAVPDMQALAPNGMMLTLCREFTRVDDWHPIQAPTSCGTADQFCPGWSNRPNGAGEDFNGAGYFRDRDGTVHLRGLVRKGGGTAEMFFLPAGYRPERTWVLLTDSTSEALARVDIHADGFVLLAHGDPSDYVTLDGLTFRCAPAGADGCPY